MAQMKATFFITISDVASTFEREDDERQHFHQEFDC
jgi:hypothetical protein